MRSLARQVLLTAAALLPGLVLPGLLMAQLAPPNARGVAMGQIHLNVRDIDAQKAFWTAIMGGVLVRNGSLEMVEFPGMYLVFSKAEQPPPPDGSVLNHFGFVVKDMSGALAKWKANNLKVDPTENPNEAFVWAPDGIRVEVYGVPDLPVPIKMNHLHYNVSDIPGMQAWYAKAFGATPGQRACVACVSKPAMIDTDDLPGVSLSFARGAEGLAPTKSRAIDHIGFEVKNLDAFAKELEARGYKFAVKVHRLPSSRIKSAFLTDPWGTSIELTEGLAPPK
jgi:catechol 2,3-dioxygenase-like lactoylglutathione lyase family enzyme